MSDFLDDIRALGSIASNFFDGKASLSQSGAALAALGTTIGGQLTREGQKLENFLGPQAAADINAGLKDAEGALSTAIDVFDADAQPYLAAGALTVEGALDSILTATVPGGTALVPFVNSGIDAGAAALKAAIDARAAAWKARLAQNNPVAAAPAVQPA